VIADAKAVICVVMDVFSASEHDTELLTPEISAAKVAMELSEGDDDAVELNVAALLRTSAQVVAVALTLLPELLEDDKLVILVFADVIASLLAFNVAALVVSPEVD